LNAKSLIVASLVLCFLFIFTTNAFASSIIRKIAVQGNTITSADSVVAMISSTEGAPYNRDLVHKDVKALFDSGRFSDVWVDKAPYQGGIKLVFHVVEKPVIEKISFEGNKKIKDKSLKKKIVVEPYTQLSNVALSESIEKIKEAYHKKDYSLVQVSYEIRTTEDGESELVFVIKENAKTLVNKVSFIGNRVFKDRELRKIVKTKKKSLLGFFSGAGKLREEFLEADVAFLMRHYLEHGYLRASVAPPQVEVTKDKRYIYITYRIEEGKQYRIRNINIAGDILTTQEELLSDLQTKEGEIYNQMMVEGDLQKYTMLYGNEGYAFANVRPIPDIHDEDDTVDITFYIEKGRRIRIEKINITGNDVTRDKVIRRELKIKENDVYSEEKIQLSKVKLMQLGYFETVDFSTPRGSRDDSLILNINVEEKPTGTFNVGAGFSTVDKFIFSASVSKKNFFGFGWSGQISAELSSRRQLFFLQMTDPYFLDTNWILGLSGFRMVYRYPEFDRKSFGGGMTIGRRLFDYSSMSLGYRYEDIKITDFSAIVPQVFKDNASGITSEVSLTLSHDTRDNRIMTTKGLYNVVTTEVSGSKLGGDNDYFRTAYNLRAFVPIKWGFVARFNGRIGYIKSLNSSPVPLFERYFLGGVNSLRGFYPLSVGPKVRIPSGPTGPDVDFVYGGNKELLFNVEIEIPLYEAGGFKGVIFFDAGNSFAENQNYSITNLLADYGVGLRWNSPMGPLRFEWGFPVNKRPGDRPVVFNFTIGSFF
jgi:outer membrane protein insertion porin family